VAEANKIQDLVFRSAYLRQVVGASGLLKRFCEEGVAALQGAMPAGRRCETVVNDGGSFSLLFDDRDEATRFRRALAQLYVEATGSTITVAQPQEMRDKDAFPQANEAARRALQQAKAAGRGPAATAQGPHVAVCSSCGVGLASKHDRLYKGDPQPAHLCASCRDKANERNSKGLDFLRGFRDAVVGVGERRFDEPGQEEEGAAAWDPRGYVAYLVADANGTGRLFGLCKTAEQLRGLSQGFTQLVTKSARVLRLAWLVFLLFASIWSEDSAHKRGY